MKPELRLFLLKNCIINPAPAARLETTSLLTLALPKLIELGIGGIATALKKAGADDTEQVTASEFTTLYVTNAAKNLVVNESLGCVLGAYGVFAEQDGRKTDGDDVALRALEAHGLVPKNADIAIIFEAAVVPTSDLTAFHLEVRHFSVRSFIDGTRGERAYVATLAVTTPSASADGRAIAIGNISLGRLGRAALPIPAGRPLGTYPRYRSNLMPWNRITGDANAAYESDVKAGTVKAGYMPVTVTLTLSETENGNKFLAALGELLGGSKKEVATEIASLISPDDRQKAAAEERDAIEKLLKAEEDARIAVKEAQANLAAAGQTPEKKAVLEAKLKAAERALARAIALREAAGLREP
jgi:hypothetical protein